MKNLITLFALICSVSLFAQKDSLQLGDTYAEDQWYVLVSYNVLNNQPTSISASGFSYGLSTGFIKDLILNKPGSVSVALGVGYGFDSFNHNLQVVNQGGGNEFQAATNFNSNKLYIHNLEFPLELRWRTSDAKTYSFWRVYGGVKASYNLSNQFLFNDASGVNTDHTNIAAFNKWQYGLTLSIGYDAFTAHMYYGLNPIFKTALLNNNPVSSRIMKIGVIFYIL